MFNIITRAIHIHVHISAIQVYTYVCILNTWFWFLRQYYLPVTDKYTRTWIIQLYVCVGNENAIKFPYWCWNTALEMKGTTTAGRTRPIKIINKCIVYLLYLSPARHLFICLSFCYECKFIARFILLPRVKNTYCPSSC